MSEGRCCEWGVELLLFGLLLRWSRFDVFDDNDSHIEFGEEFSATSDFCSDVITGTKCVR